MEIFFNGAHQFCLPTEVTGVPGLVSITPVNIDLLELPSVLKELIKELDRKHFYLLKGFELTHVHMSTLCYVEKNAIDKV